MAGWSSQSIERVGYINRVRMHGFVESSIASNEFDSLSQLEVQIRLQYPGGKAALIQPVTFLSPHASLIEAATLSKGKWAHVTGRVYSDHLNGKLKTWVIGERIQFGDIEDQSADRQDLPYLNNVTLHGLLTAPPRAKQDDGYPLQLTIPVGIWMQAGKQPMIQRVLFIDPPAALVQEALKSESKFVHVTGHMMTAIFDDDWETHVFGSTIRFVDAIHEPSSRDY